MLPLSATWTCETRLPPEAGIPELWDTTVSGTSGVSTDTVCPGWARGITFKRRVLCKCLLNHRQFREAKVWVEAEVSGHRPTLQGPKGVFTP